MRQASSAVIGSTHCLLLKSYIHKSTAQQAVQSCTDFALLLHMLAWPQFHYNHLAMALAYVSKRAWLAGIEVTAIVDPYTELAAFRLRKHQSGKHASKWRNVAIFPSYTAMLDSKVGLQPFCNKRLMTLPSAQGKCHSGSPLNVSKPRLVCAVLSVVPSLYPLAVTHAGWVCCKAAEQST